MPDMPFDDGDSEGEVPMRHKKIPHYHGDEVRVIFVVSAIVLIIAQSTDAHLPFSTFGAVLSAILLVVAAGITNPSGGWIHWVNALIAVLGILIFGTSAVAHYREGINVFDPSFMYIEALSLLSIFALYFTTRTIRGFHSHIPIP